MESGSNRRPAFREVQTFRQPLLWGLLLVSLFGVVALFGYGMIQQLVFGESWGDRPMSDTWLVIVGTGSILFTAGFVYLFRSLKLITEVRDDGVHVRFCPLRLRIIPFAQIESCNSQEYRPIRDYGGWGIRYGRRGKAYNVSGNQGVLLHLKGEKPLLIGSQKPQQLAQQIQARLPGKR